MPSLRAATASAFKEERNGVKVYAGVVDGTWSVQAVPNGGYALGLVLDACLRHQVTTNHKDLIHVTAHFLQTTAIAPFEVHIRILKTGRGYSNLLADLVQDKRIRITTHCMFGVLAPPTQDYPSPHLTLAPPSTYARRLPLYQHPGTIPTSALQTSDRYIFKDIVSWVEDKQILAKNAPDAPGRTRPNSIGGDGLEWGAWYMLKSEDEDITTPSLAFFLDAFVNPVLLLPSEERDGLGFSWFPTMVLSIDFKFPIPPADSPFYSRNTIGIYSNGKFINDPQARHDIYTEAWTSPCDLCSGKEEEGWREKQICLATSTQMALVMPMEVNHRMGKKGSKL